MQHFALERVLALFGYNLWSGRIGIQTEQIIHREIQTRQALGGKGVGGLS